MFVWVRQRRVLMASPCARTGGFLRRRGKAWRKCCEFWVSAGSARLLFSLTLLVRLEQILVAPLQETHFAGGLRSIPQAVKKRANPEKSARFPGREGNGVR